MQSNQTDIKCGVCQGQNFRPLFQKKSEKGETFTLARCRRCGTVQTLPRPTAEELAACYQGDYFERRTDRGYANYTSEPVRRQVERVFTLNLRDLRFFEWESQLRQSGGSGRPRSLDVGCAAGFFVRFLSDRGWDSEGIEISAPMARYAADQLGLRVREGDFLSESSDAPYDLVTLWASLEHFPDPCLLAARLSEAVLPGGRLILSTCRWGLLSSILGARWRYMNVPEHLFFFSRKGLERLFKQYGFEAVAATTYGSGFTARPSAGRWYALAKRLADPLVKWTNQGDMMALHFRRR